MATQWGVKQGVVVREVISDGFTIEVAAHAAVNAPLQVLLVERHGIATQQFHEIEAGSEQVVGLHLLHHVG